MKKIVESYGESHALALLILLTFWLCSLAG